MPISLAAVFIPILFMGGILGRLFHEFAVTIGAAILVSGFVSLTLTPLLSAKFLRPHKAMTQWKHLRATERMIDGMLTFQGRGLRLARRRRATTLVLSCIVLAATVWLFISVPKGFIPNEDQNEVRISLEAAQGTSFPELVRHQRMAMDIVSKGPRVATFFSFVGRGGANNSSVISLRLVPKGERKASIDDVMNDLRPKLNAIPGFRVSLQNPPPIRLGGRQANSQYQYTLQSADTAVLYDASQKMLEKMRALPGFVDVNTDLFLRNPTVNVEIDRDRAATLGLTANQVEDALFSSYATRQVSTIYAPNNTYQVIMELDPEFQKNPQALSLLYVRSASGGLVPLDSVARLVPTVGPLAVNHSGQAPSVTLSFNLKTGTSLGDAVKEIDAAAKSLPASVTTSFQGTAQAFQSSLQGLGLLLVIAIAVIYLVLGILYESFIHPITILSALPFAGFGALLTLLIFKVDLSIYAFVGIIMLVGLVKKNGIMMIDFAIEEQKKGKSADEAIYEACVVRFRPIMMTTMAALMGTLPLAFGFGAGAESRRPLGLAVVGGLIFSQTLTLYVTPVFFLYMEKLRGGKPKDEVTPGNTLEELSKYEREAEPAPV